DRIRRNRGRIQDWIIMILTGPYAQRRYAPSSRWRYDARSDFHHVSRWVSYVHSGGVAARNYRRYVGAVAKELVDGHWGEIKAVARHLLKHHTMQQHEVQEIANSAATRAERVTLKATVCRTVTRYYVRAEANKRKSR